MTSERLFNSFIPPPKKNLYTPQKQISGYAPGSIGLDDAGTENILSGSGRMMSRASAIAGWLWHTHIRMSVCSSVTSPDHVIPYLPDLRPWTPAAPEFHSFCDNLFISELYWFCAQL